MAITRFAEDLNIIALLSNLPNDNDGLSADELKAKFDLAGNLLKDYINEVLIPELETDIAAAARGITQAGLSGNDIKNGTISASKLNQTPGLEAVITDVIRDAAVTAAKIAAGAITSEKLALNSVSTNNIQNNSVTANKLSPEVRDVFNTIITQAVLDAALQGYQTRHKTATATLNAGTTSWNIPVQGVTATNSVIVVPASNSSGMWKSKNIRCTGQSTNSLTFAADSAPTSSVSVNVLILD